MFEGRQYHFQIFCSYCYCCCYYSCYPFCYPCHSYFSSTWKTETSWQISTWRTWIWKIWKRWVAILAFLWVFLSACELLERVRIGMVLTIWMGWMWARMLDLLLDRMWEILWDKMSMKRYTRGRRKETMT